MLYLEERGKEMDINRLDKRYSILFLVSILFILASFCMILFTKFHGWMCLCGAITMTLGIIFATLVAKYLGNHVECIATNIDNQKAHTYIKMTCKRVMLLSEISPEKWVGKEHFCYYKIHNDEYVKWQNEGHRFLCLDIPPKYLTCVVLFGFFDYYRYRHWYKNEKRMDTRRERQKEIARHAEEELKILDALKKDVDLFQEKGWQ